MRRFVRHIPSVFACSLCATLLVGCSDAPHTTFAVQGTVKLDGQPLRLPEGSYRGTVMFVSEAQDGQKGYTARGTVLPDGTYHLTTFETGDGAVAGKHRVAVVVTQVEENPTTNAPRVPAKYANPQKSGITCEVTASPENHIDIELSSNS